MPTYRYRYDGPRDSDISTEIGIPVASNPIEPELTKDYDLDSAQDEPVLREALVLRGWSFVQEVV